jgi:flagellar biosynthetic protein FlhB
VSAPEDGAERSHEATPQKLEEARRKGEVVRSQDVAVAASYLGALLCLPLAADALGARMLALGGGMLARADAFSAALLSGGAAGGRVLLEAMGLAALIVGPAAALVLAGLFAQRALTFAPSKLAPKLSRISPLANAKQKFGPSGLFEFAKSTVKMSAFGALLVWILSRRAEEIVASAAADPVGVTALMPWLLTEFLLAVVIVSGAIAAVDYAWQRRTHLAKNRMTRQELLDETKRSEGDPHLKARRRQRGQELATNRMLGDVAGATVVVVNPTHYAVALRWSATDPTPPVCVAKGVDEIAFRIREAAAAHGVPIHSDPPTARALHATVEIGAPVDREHFAAVAAAIRFAQRMRDAAKGRA